MVNGKLFIETDAAKASERGMVMILADKIILLRKKNGWSQEELAEKMNVSRQSVSKWEGAQSVPDLNKVLQLSKIFGVSTDYLLRDEIEVEEFVNDVEDSESVHRVSMEEANEFLSIKEETGKLVALATFISIISPICLLILGAGSETRHIALSENIAGGIGLCIMFLLIIVAVAIFIHCGMQTSPFEHLQKNEIETEYGVTGMVKERKKQYQGTYSKYNIIGTCLCIFSLIPLFAASALTENEFYMAIMLCILLFLAGIGVIFFIIAGTNYTSMEVLLQEGDYTKQKKSGKSVTSVVSIAYWLITTAIYLAYSLTTENWGRSWIIWPVAGVFYGAIEAVCGAIENRKGK